MRERDIRCQGKSTTRGVGLLEVLVTLVILSLGFLTATTMQTEALRTNQSTLYQIQALTLASDMMDRMRGNPAGVAAGSYDGKVSLAAPTTQDCITSGCTSAEMAVSDIYEWSTQLSDILDDEGFVPLLPADSDGNPAVGSITKAATGEYTISLDWKEYKNGADKAYQVAVVFMP